MKGKTEQTNVTWRQDKIDPKKYKINSPILLASGPIDIRVPRNDDSLKEINYKNLKFYFKLNQIATTFLKLKFKY